MSPNKELGSLDINQRFDTEPERGWPLSFLLELPAQGSSRSLERSRPLRAQSGRSGPGREDLLWRPPTVGHHSAQSSRQGLKVSEGDRNKMTPRNASYELGYVYEHLRQPRPKILFAQLPARTSVVTETPWLWVLGNCPCDNRYLNISHNGWLPCCASPHPPFSNKGGLTSQLLAGRGSDEVTNLWPCSLSPFSSLGQYRPTEKHWFCYLWMMWPTFYMKEFLEPTYHVMAKF